MVRFFKAALCALLCLWVCACAPATDVSDPLMGGNLSEDWVKDTTDKGKGTITTGADGVTLTAGKRHYILVKRRNDVVGSDSHPLSVSVHIQTETGCDLTPGLHLYWDNQNLVSLMYGGDEHLYVRTLDKGVLRDFPFYNVVPGKVRTGLYVRAVLTSHNVFIQSSRDGESWRRHGSLNLRPGREGQGPAKILLGRGWPGEPGNKDARADLANDYYAEREAKPGTSVFKHFSLKDTPPLLPADPPKFEAREAWQNSLDELDASGVPRKWQLLGPRPDRDFQLFRRHDLAPEQSDDWKTIPKDETGKRPFLSRQWSRPEEDNESYVSLGDILDLNQSVLAFAKTEIEWPLDGQALVWFDGDGRFEVYLNNRQVYSDEQKNRNESAMKDRRCFLANLQKGVNTLKIKAGQARGPWGFFLRVERNDPGYRILMLERLMELYPKEAPGWRGCEARLEIARRYEQMDRYPDALAAYQKAVEAMALEDDYRVEALGGQLRLLDNLRDWSALAAAGDRYLSRFGRRPGALLALQACVRAEALQGKAEAAETRVNQWLAQAGENGEEVLHTLRMLAGAMEGARLPERQWAVLERLAEHPAVEKSERARAAFEAAFYRVHADYEKAGRGEKPEPQRLAAACKAAQKGLALLPGSSNPQVAAFVQDAEADLKAGNPERAVMGFWGAALLSQCVSDPQAAKAFALGKAYKLPPLALDPKTGRPKEELQEGRKTMHKAIEEAVGAPKWSGPWRAIGPFENKDGVGERTAYGPEKSQNYNDKHPGRGGAKGWLEVDPAKAQTDFGQDLHVLLGDCKEGLAYVAREFELPAARATTLHLAMRAGWFAWLDGAPIGEKTEDTFRYDGTRLPLNLKAGKHTLLLKVVSPDNGPCSFRVRLNDEPELALWLLLRVAMAREYCDAKNFYLPFQDLWWMQTNLASRVDSDALYALGNALATLYPANTSVRWDASYWTFDRLLDYSARREAADGYRALLVRLETWADFPGRDAQLWSAANRLAQILMSDGEAGAADAVLAHAIASYPVSSNDIGNALIQRGTLYEDYALSQASRPFFERAVREFPQVDLVQRFAAQGLEFARSYRPERLTFETTHEVQAAIEAAQRQMASGQAEDVERAMRNLGEVMRSGVGSLIRLSDSLFTPRYLGVRETVRALLARMGEDVRAIYLKTVEKASNERLKAAAEWNDPSAMEAVAGAFQSTPAAARALNQAGNLYMDRGAFSQAASAFRLLLADYRGLDFLQEPLLAAKIARALILDGQVSAAKAAAERLGKEYGDQTLHVAGKPVSGGEYSRALLAQLGAANTPAALGDLASAATTYGANVRRTGAPLNAPAPTPGPVGWARALVQSASMDLSRQRFWPDPFARLQSYPVLGEGRAFFTTLESIQSVEVATGKVLWTQAWGSSGALGGQRFSGFPVSCPTYRDGKVYVRVLDGRRSALNCYRADTGALRWSTSAVPELNKVAWVSEPLVAYGFVIGVFAEPSLDMNRHGLAALDMETGRFRWKRPLLIGNTGIRAGTEYYGSTFQLGPPAADGGVIYAPTGLGTVAAVEAFTGDVLWLSGYPRLQFKNPDYMNSGISSDGRLRTLKLLGRGPAAPIVCDDVIVVAPKDAAGLIAFERLGGAIRWSQELLDARYFPGLCEENVLAVDDAVKAFNAKTGALVWEYGLQGEALFGQPGYSGGMLYLPTAESLQVVDARTGKLASASPWDPRVGPLGNLTVGSDVLVGVNEKWAACLRPAGAPPVPMPLAEADQLALAGQLAAAAERYAQAAQGGGEEVLPALSGRVKMLQKLDRKEEALADIERLLAGQPDELRSTGGLWCVSKEVMAEVLGARLGKPAAPPLAVPDGLAGVLSYAWQLEGSAPKLYLPRDGAKDRFFACAGNNLYLLRLAPRFEVLWKTYVGPDTSRIEAGPSVVVACNPQKLTVIDRDTGEVLWQRFLPADKSRARARANASRFQLVAVDENFLAAVAGDGLFVYDLRTRKERWANERRQRMSIGLSFVDGHLVEVYGHNRQDTLCVTYDPQTGNTLRRNIVARQAEYTEAVLSPDGKLLVLRPQGNKLTAVDLVNGKEAWSAQVPMLDGGNWGRLGISFVHGAILYFGDTRDGDRLYQTLCLNPDNGKILRKVPGACSFLGSSYVHFRDHYGKTVVRVDEENQGSKEVWKTTLPDHLCTYHSFIRGFLSQSQDRFYALYALGNAGSDQFVLRVYDWASGQVLSNEILPGTPLRSDYSRGVVSEVSQAGNLLFYGAAEGLFALAPMGETKGEIAAKLRKDIADPALAARQKREEQRALAAIEPVTLQAFLAPSDAKVDGDLSEWHATDPLVLDGASQFIPLANRAAWGGAEDLSAKIYTAWNASDLLLAVDVRDDRFVPPLPGAGLTSGDAVQIAVNSTTVPLNGFDRRENVVCSLALVDGRTVLETEADDIPDAQTQPRGRVLRSADGKGLRYELAIPWPLLRREARYRPGDAKELRAGVAVYDDDGEGVKGALEWGAGVTSPALTPVRLGNLSLLDISIEKIERYRKVINKIPDSAEALRYLQLILLSKRGVKAALEQAAEVEEFVKAHPASRNASRALAWLRDAYRKQGEAGAQERTVAFAKAARCPAGVTDGLTGKVFRCWVLPDAKNPPRMIMVQFNLAAEGWARRAYWGESRVDWGRDGTVQRMSMGALPAPGQWTQLEIPALDFQMEEADIKGVAFTSYGGLCHFDKAGVTVAGQQTTLLDDNLPPKFTLEGNKVDFTANPRKEGASSWTAGPTAGLLNSHFYPADGSNWFSFKDPNAPKPPEPDPVKLQALYREAAHLVSDTGEGLVFLRRAIECKREEGPGGAIKEYEAYLRAHPETLNAVSILQALRELYTQEGGGNPVWRCEELMQDCKLPRDAKRSFYAQTIPCWTEWQVLGPFQAVGERRGLDQELPPDRGVDLAWQTKGPYDTDLAWTKMSAQSSDKKRPNTNGYVDLAALLVNKKLDEKQFREVANGPYFAYAYRKISLQKERTAYLYVGVNDMLSIQVNGRWLVTEAQPGAEKDRMVKEIKLVNGDNAILIKAGVRAGRLGFSFRIADENGRPFDDLPKE